MLGGIPPMPGAWCGEPIAILELTSPRLQRTYWLLGSRASTGAPLSVASQKLALKLNLTHGSLAGKQGTR